MDVDLHHPHHLTHSHPQYNLQQQQHPNQHPTQHQNQQRQQQHQLTMNPSTSTSSPSANSSLATGTGATSSGVVGAIGTGAAAAATPAGGPQIRSRITVVCAECKRLKLKCDRRAPCGSCMKRDTVVRCIYSPAAAEKVDLHSLNNRLIQVEAILAMLTSGQQPPAPFQSAYPYTYPYSTPGAGNGAPSTGGGNIHTNANAPINGVGSSSSSSVGGGIPLVLPGSLSATFGHGSNGNGGPSAENAADAANSGSWSGTYALNSSSEYSSTLPGANGQPQSHSSLGHGHHEHHHHHHHYAAPPQTPGSNTQKDRLGIAPEDVVSIWLDDLDRGVAKEWLGDAVAAGSSSRSESNNLATTTKGTAGSGSASTLTLTNMTTNTTGTNTNTTTTTNTTTHANVLGYNFEYAFDANANGSTSLNPVEYIKLEPSSVDIELASSSFQYSYPTPYPSTTSVSPPTGQTQSQNRNSMIIDLDTSDAASGGSTTTAVPSTFASTSTAHIDSTSSFPSTSNSGSTSLPRHQQQHILLPALSIYYPLPSITPPGTSPSSSAAFPAVSPPVPTSLPPRPPPGPQPQPPCPPSPSSHPTHLLSPLSGAGDGVGSLPPPSLTSGSTSATGGASGGYVFPPFSSSSPLSTQSLIQIGSQQQQQPQPQSPFHQQQNPHHPFNINTSHPLASKSEITKIKTKPQITPALISLLPPTERCKALLKEARSVVLGVRCVPLVPFPVSESLDGFEGDLDGDGEKEKETGEGYGKMWDSFERRCVSLLSGSSDGVPGGLYAEKERERARERERERARERLREKAKREKAREARRARQIYFGGIVGLGGGGGAGQRSQRMEDVEGEEADDENQTQKQKGDRHEREDDGGDMRPRVDLIQEEDRQSEEDFEGGYVGEDRDREDGEERDGALESLPFFATMCAVLAIGAAISTRTSLSSPASSSSSSPHTLSPPSQHQASSPNPSPAFLYALSQQALDVWDAHSRPEAESGVLVHQRTEYVLGYVVGVVYLLLRMSGSGSSALDVVADEPSLNEEEKTREREQEKEGIRVLMHKMVSAARDAGLETARDGMSGSSFLPLASAGKGIYSARSGPAKSAAGGTKKRGAGTIKPTSKGKSSTLKGKKSKLSWERERERSAAAKVDAQEEWSRMVIWEVLFYDLFTSDMLGHEPYVPSSVYTSLKLPTCSSASSSIDGDLDFEEDEHYEGDYNPHFGVDRCIYAYLGARYRLARISSLVKARMADPECCCGYTFDQASKLEEEIVKWNIWFSRRLDSPSSSSSSSASSSSTLGSSKASDEDDNDDKDEDGTLLLAQRAELAVWANILVVKIYTPFLRHAASAASSSTSTSSSSSSSQRPQHAPDADPPASVGPALTAAYQTTVRAAQAIVRASQCVMKTSSLSKSPVLAKFTPVLFAHGQAGHVADSEVEVATSFDVPMDMGVDMHMQNPLDVDMEGGVGVDVGLDVGLDADLRQAVAQARGVGRMGIQHGANPTIPDPFPLRPSPRHSEGGSSRVATASKRETRPKTQVLPAFFDFYPLEKVVFDAVVICAHAGLELAPRPAPGRSLLPASSPHASTEFDPSPATTSRKVKGNLSPILDVVDVGLNMLSDLCGPAASRGWGWGWGKQGVGEAQKRVMEVLYHRAGTLRAAGTVPGRVQPQALDALEARYGQKIHANASPTLIGNSNVNALKRKHDQIKLGGAAQTVPRSLADDVPRHPAFGEIMLSPAVDLSVSTTSTSNQQQQQTNNPYPFGRTIAIPDASNNSNASPASPNTPGSHPAVVNFPQDLMQRNERQKLELTSALTSVATARLSAAVSSSKGRERNVKEMAREAERGAPEDGSESEKEKERKHPRKSAGGTHRPSVGFRLRHGTRDELGGMRARAVTTSVGGQSEPLPLMTSKPRPFPPSTKAIDTANPAFGLQHKQKTQTQPQQQQQQPQHVIGGVMLAGDHDETDDRHRSRSSSFVQAHVSEQQQLHSLSQYQQPSNNTQRNKFPMYDISPSVRQQPQSQLSPVHSPFTPRSAFDHTQNIHNNSLYDQPPDPQARTDPGFSTYDGTTTSSGDNGSYNSHNNSNPLVSSPFSSASLGVGGGNTNGPPSSSGSPFTTSSVSSSSGGGGPHPSTPTFNAMSHPTSPPHFGPHPHPSSSTNGSVSLSSAPVPVSVAASPVIGYFHTQGGSFDHQESSLSGMEHLQHPHHHAHHHHQQQQQQQQQQEPQPVGRAHEHGQISLGVEIGMEQNMMSLAGNNAMLYDKHPQSQHSQQQHMYDVKPQPAGHMQFLQHPEERQQSSHSHQQQQHPPQHHRHLMMGPPPSHMGYEDETMDATGQSQAMSLGMAVSSAWPTAGAGQEQQQQQQTQAAQQQNAQPFWGNDPNFRFYT